MHLQDPFTIPVPLRSPDADVPLDLGEAITAIYERLAIYLITVTAAASSALSS